MLNTLAVLLAAAVLLVPLSRRLGLGSVLGYLVAGALIGPSGLRLVGNVGEVAEVSELGITMLLFLIGLELRPRRLWVMRRAVFVLGAAQVVATAALLAALIHAAPGLAWPAAVVLGGGLALSSTALVLPLLAERELLGAVAGRDAFAVLLFQDLAFIPLVAAVPLLADGVEMPRHVPWADVAQAAAAVIALLVGGRFIVPPVFRAIGGARTPEVFTATALLIVVGTAALAHMAGLSTSLGAFLAGVLLSDSEYRHELQADIEAFEGLLLGFFFMSVGMTADLGLALRDPGFFAVAVIGLVAVKAAVAFALGRAARQGARDAIRFALALPQGSEFAFVLFGAAVAAGSLGRAEADRATLVVALSLVATPFLFAASERLLVPRFLRRAAERPYDVPDGADAPVLILGFGRVGQIVGRILTMRRVRFTALEKDAAQVEFVRRFGGQVYYGDPTRPDLLRAAGAERAKLLVVALDDAEESLRVVDVVRRTFPNLRIVARARNRQHAFLLMDHGVGRIVRETFYSSLRLTEMVLEDLGVSPAEARRTVELFREHDERLLARSHAFHDDERRLIQTVQDAARELAELFEADRQRGAIAAKKEKKALGRASGR
jgi:monovalent cation:proton antiporter-2 (CPA2) family protein